MVHVPAPDPGAADAEVAALLLQGVWQTPTQTHSPVGRVTVRLTFRIVTSQLGEVGILCLACGRTSWNPHDVGNLYCGHCHAFHLEPLPGSRVAVEEEFDAP